MAEQTNVEPNVPAKKGMAARLLPWGVTTLIVVVFAAGGFMIGRLFGTRGTAQTASAADQTPTTQSVGGHQTDGQADTGESWYYDLEPVVANLNEPGVTRYVRVGLTFEISNTLKQEEGKALLDQKKPLLKHWLTLYLSNQTIEDTRGERNLLRMQAQISDAFNQGLFPNAKPHIRRVLFEVLSIQ